MVLFYNGDCHSNVYCYGCTANLTFYDSPASGKTFLLIFSYFGYVLCAISRMFAILVFFSLYLMLFIVLYAYLNMFGSSLIIFGTFFVIFGMWNSFNVMENANNVVKIVLKC